MATADRQLAISEDISRQAAHARRMVIIHQRAWRFRPWGLVEYLLMIGAAVVMIPFWIYLLIVGAGPGMGGADDAGGDGGGGSSQPRRSKDVLRLKVSRLAHYHQELLIRLLGDDSEILAESRTRPDGEQLGRQIVAAALDLAAGQRLVVEERVAASTAVGAASSLAGLWYGGRPLMTSPGLRAAAQVEAALADKGFAFERAEGKVTVRRKGRALARDAYVLVLVLVLAAGIAVLTLTPLVMLFYAPAVVFFLLLTVPYQKDLLFEFVAGVLFQRERHQLTLTAHDVQYRGGLLWRRQRAATEGDRLRAVGLTAGLTWDKRVALERRAIRIIGADSVTVLPPSFSDGAASLLRDWIASTTLTLQQSAEEHDFRSRCAYCGSLYDWAAEQRCPSCGAANLRGV